MPQPERPAEPPPPTLFAWRSAIGVTLTREQARTAWNTPKGPCARCAAPHHRYGEGGQPLCAACRQPASTPAPDPTGAAS